MNRLQNSIFTISTGRVRAPVLLGVGGFVIAYVASDGLVAYEGVSHSDDAEKLNQEH